MADSLAAEAFAKVNLGLIVKSRGSDGYHPLISLAQSVSWADRLELRTAEDDRFTAEGMEASDDNLAWRAALAVRAHAGTRRPVALHLDKRIAIAAGLGGGSADAAAALALTGRLFGVPLGDLAPRAEELGADVPFCLTGGLAILEGRGDRITRQQDLGGFALAIAVPDIELSTPAVYGRWDEMDGPTGVPFPVSQLPPGMRGYEPLRNDLHPAARALTPELADREAELAAAWGRPIAMSGSGPALFGFFVDEEEAAGALASAPPGLRATAAVVPVPRGWRKVPGTLTGPE